jgi:hypothetical protein
MERLFADCYEGRPPSEEQIQKLWELAYASEPAIHPYLKECACCFAAGAYSAAIVAAWCAIARYLRLVVEAVGLEVAQLYYYEQGKGQARQPFSELIQRSDKPFYIAYKRMRLYEENLVENVKKLDDLYKKRCQYAHPTGEKATLDEAFEYVLDAEWLLTRRVDQERFQDISVVLQYAEKAQINEWSAERARVLVLRVRKEQRESLAVEVLSSALSEDRAIPLDRLLVLWDALKPLLSEASRSRLMEKLAALLSDYLYLDQLEVGKRPPPIDEVIDVADLAQLVFWPEAHHQEPIWDYFDQRLDDPNLTRGIAAQLKRYAPSPYRERVGKAWPNV